MAGEADIRREEWQVERLPSSSILLTGSRPSFSVKLIYCYYYLHLPSSLDVIISLKMTCGRNDLLVRSVVPSLKR